MILVVTTNVSGRIRGYLCSLFLEIAPTVYLASGINRSARSRIWDVLVEWFSYEEDGASIIMAWRDSTVISGVAYQVLGDPAISIIELDGVLLGLKPIKNK